MQLSNFKYSCIVIRFVCVIFYSCQSFTHAKCHFAYTIDQNQVDLNRKLCTKVKSRSICKITRKNHANDHWSSLKFTSKGNEFVT